MKADADIMAIALIAYDACFNGNKNRVGNTVLVIMPSKREKKQHTAKVLLTWILPRVSHVIFMSSYL